MSRKSLAAVVTVSDRVSSGVAEDESGPEAARLLLEQGFTVVEQLVVADDVVQLRTALQGLVDRGVQLVVTTGGTGVAPRDVTPEVTEQLCERLVPGIPELMRKVSLAKTPHAALSRAAAGISSKSLIVNLPGSPGAVRDCLAALEEVLHHAVELISDERTEHRQTG